MKRRQHTNGSLFLLEILLNIMLFMVLMVIALRFFMKSHQLTSATTQLHEAVAICNNTAAMFESGDGEISSIRDYYEFETPMADQIIVHFNSSFEECSSEDAHYYLVVSKADKTSCLSCAKISYYDMAGEEIYSLTASHYQQLTPKKAEVTRE